jgi:hypothetical protein
MVQILSTSETQRRTQKSTHGSGWIVQILSTSETERRTQKSHPREWVDCSDPFYDKMRRNLLR